MDIFSSYEQGLKALLERLGKDHPRYTEALAFQSRLWENMSQTQQYGDTETRRAERAQVVDALNQLGQDAAEVSFNELCGMLIGIEGTSGTWQVYEQRYLEHVRRECSALYTEGIYQDTAPLSDVFVMLEAVGTQPREMRADIPIQLPQERGEATGARDRNAPDGESRHREAIGTKPEFPPPPVPLSRALQEHQHLVILGDPGSGKTTTLQFIALCFATDGWAREKLGLNEIRVPIRVELRGYRGTEQLTELLVKAVNDVGQFDLAPEQSYQIAITLLKSWLTEGRLVILLDGLDEVPEMQRIAVVKAIDRFVTTKEGRSCRVVVTARIAGYRESRPLGEPFNCYTIRPFTGLDDALPYAVGWLKVTARLAQEETESRARELLEEIEQSGLRSVMGNPLLLRLAIGLFAEHGEVIRDRAELYERYVNEVLIARERRRDTQVRWNNQQIGDALEAIAWSLQTEEKKTAAELSEIVKRQVEGVEDSERLVSYLRERLGLLASYGYERGELVGFRHANFREFFVAQRLARAWKDEREQAWRFLKPRLHHPNWREPILLLAEMLDLEEATGLVGWILKAKSLYERELYRDLLLAGECLHGGVQLAPELRQSIVEKLLRLYLEQLELAIGDLGRPAIEKLVIQPIEKVLSSFENDERVYLTSRLLKVATEKTRYYLLDFDQWALVGKTLLVWPRLVLAAFVELSRTFFDLFREFGAGWIVYLFRNWSNRNVLGPPPRGPISDPSLSIFGLGTDSHRFISSLVMPIHLPSVMKDQREGKQNFKRRTVIRALSRLRIRSLEATDFLVSSLEDIATCKVATEALGKTGPGTADIVMALIDAHRQRREVYGWDEIWETTIEALGVLGQRHAEIVELLLGIVQSADADSIKLRYAITQSLCKAAETDTRALAFVLEGWQRVYHATWNRDASKDPDEAVREGLKDGRELFNSASPEVIRYLLDTIWDYDVYHRPSPEVEFLSKVVGDTPLVQCKVVERDGTIRYHALDLTEELFSLFLQRAPNHIAGNFASHLLSIWGTNRPDLVARLIQLVRESDAWVLASVLEDSLLARIREDQTLEALGRTRRGALSQQPLDQSTIEYQKQYIALLRNPDKVLRDAVLNIRLMAAGNAPQEESFLGYLPRIIESTKCTIHYNVYHSIYNRIWAISENHWPNQVPSPDPYVVAATACFRGWASHALPYATVEEMREEIREGTNFALSMLQTRDRRSVEILSSIVNSEVAEFFGSGLKKTAEEDIELDEDLELEQPLWYRRRKPDFRERSAAAFALAELASDYQDAQTVLVSHLKPKCLETEFQEQLIRALGSIQSANRDLVAALLDIVIHHDRKVYWAGSHALGRLRNPSPEAAAFLCTKYEDLGEAEYSRAKSAVLKALSTVEPYTPQIIDLFLKALEDKKVVSSQNIGANPCDRPGGQVQDLPLPRIIENIQRVEIRNAAAEGLGNVREADPKIVKALLDALQNTAMAAGALGNLSGLLASTDSGIKLLREMARALRHLIERPNLCSGIELSDRDVRGIAYEALVRVVEEITVLEVKDSPVRLSLSG